jgi:hypothetical protein
VAQSTIANARLGAKSGIGLLLDNANENVAVRQVDGENLKYLKDVKPEEKYMERRRL